MYNTQGQSRTASLDKERTTPWQRHDKRREILITGIQPRSREGKDIQTITKTWQEKENGMTDISET
jgi:hypothetical protein